MPTLVQKTALRDDAIRRLVELGVFIPVSETEMYHGRTAKNGDGDFFVLSNYNNADNATGHLNINQVSALNMGDEKTAEKFAETRKREEGGNAEIHKIVPIESNLYMINTKLSKEEIQSKEVQSLLQELLIPDASKESISVKFEDREVFNRISKRMRFSGLFLNFIDRDTALKYIKDNQFNDKESEIAMQIVKAINSKLLCQTNIVEAIDRYMGGNYAKRLGKDGKMHALTHIIINGKYYDYSPEYISSFLSENNIIGRLKMVYSATISEKIDAYQIFALDKINTEKEVGERLRSAVDSYSVVSDLFMDKKGDLNLRMLSKTPEEIIEYVFSKSKTANYLFSEQTGVWENFKLGEHTESVLRFFDDNFSTYLPAKAKAMMKLVILCHDIGKPIVNEKGVRKGTPEEIEIYKKAAANMCKELGAKEPLSDFIIDFVFKTQKCTTEFYVLDNQNALEELDNSCKTLLKEYGIPDKDGLSESLTQFARILQTCDSGAYTIYGKTRKFGTDIYYQNANLKWSEEFVKTEQGYRFKQDTELIAGNRPYIKSRL